MNLQTYRVGTISTILTLGILANSALGQTAPLPATPEQTVVRGTVVSSKENSLVVRTEDKVYHVFVFDRSTVKPAGLTANTFVRVYSLPTAEAGVRLATDISVSAAPATPAAGGATPQETEPVPTSVRNVENDIERAFRKFHAGVRGGVSVARRPSFSDCMRRWGRTLIGTLYSDRTSSSHLEKSRDCLRLISKASSGCRSHNEMAAGPLMPAPDQASRSSIETSRRRRNPAVTLTSAISIIIPA